MEKSYEKLSYTFHKYTYLYQTCNGGKCVSIQKDSATIISTKSLAALTKDGRSTNGGGRDVRGALPMQGYKTVLT